MSEPSTAAILLAMVGRSGLKISLDASKVGLDRLRHPGLRFLVCPPARTRSVPSRAHRPHSVPHICGSCMTSKDNESAERLFRHCCDEGQSPNLIRLGLTL